MKQWLEDQSVGVQSQPNNKHVTFQTLVDLTVRVEIG